MQTAIRTPLLALALAVGVTATVGLASPAPTDATDRKRPVDALRAARTDDADEERRKSLAERAARLALQAVGTPYRYGGESPSSGFDCSGLVRWAYGRVGIDLPHSSYALASVGRAVERKRLRAGDVLLFEGLGHVGLYLGRGRMVHAPQTGRSVEVVQLRATAYGARLAGARRVVSL